jgi:3-amino-4-hydroxybenzoic acid synthase
VNAGAIHSYLLCPENQTRYLSDVSSGDAVLGVDSSGRGRNLVVGRVKIERRPLRMIQFEREGQWGAAFVQDDWHVRVIGAGGEVLNVTDCRPGTKLLGVQKGEARHCGIPIEEELIER